MKFVVEMQCFSGANYIFHVFYINFRFPTTEMCLLKCRPYKILYISVVFAACTNRLCIEVYFDVIAIFHHSQITIQFHGT